MRLFVSDKCGSDKRIVVLGSVIVLMVVSFCLGASFNLQMGPICLLTYGEREIIQAARDQDGGVVLIVGYRENMGHGRLSERRGAGAGKVDYRILSYKDKAESDKLRVVIDKWVFEP